VADYYFTAHPRVSYDVTGKRVYQTAIDITSRFRITDLVKNSAVVLYKYSVKDGERPDVIAHKYYEDETLDWLVLLSNEIHDPYFQWPMSTVDFERYIRQKYGSVANAQEQVHSYVYILNQASKYVDESGVTTNVSERTLVVDRSTYLTLDASSRRQLSAYDHEVKENDARRNIVLIDKAYVPIIKKSLRRIYETL
jgi:hypothetical protein